MTVTDPRPRSILHRAIKMPQPYKVVLGIVNHENAQRWADICRAWALDPDVLGFFYLTHEQAKALGAYWQSIADRLATDGGAA